MQDDYGNNNNMNDTTHSRFRATAKSRNQSNIIKLYNTKSQMGGDYGVISSDSIQILEKNVTFNEAQYEDKDSLFEQPDAIESLRKQLNRLDKISKNKN